MSSHTAHTETLVPVHIEQRITPEEGRIRAVAVQSAMRSIPGVILHLNALIMAEDLAEIHTSAAEKYDRLRNMPHFVELHQIHSRNAPVLATPVPTIPIK